MLAQTKIVNVTTNIDQRMSAVKLIALHNIRVNFTHLVTRKPIFGCVCVSLLIALQISRSDFILAFINFISTISL